MLENPLYKSQSETWLRLCDIEDILGDDYDLDHLRELIRADRYELRYGPTFKIGDSVWQTDGIDVYELKVKRLPGGGADPGLPGPAAVRAAAT